MYGVLPLVGIPSVVWVAIALVEGVGPMGCGRNIGSDGSCGSSRRKTGWHIWLSALTIGIVIDVVEMVVVSVEIMMASISFVNTAFWTYWCVLFLFSHVGALWFCWWMIWICLKTRSKSGSCTCTGSETEIWTVLVWLWLEMMSLNLMYCSSLCLSSVARIPFIFLICPYRSCFQLYVWFDNFYLT